MVPLMRRRMAMILVNLVMQASSPGFGGGVLGGAVSARSFLWFR